MTLRHICSLGAVSLKFRSSLLGTNSTNLGANLPPKCSSETASCSWSHTSYTGGTTISCYTSCYHRRRVLVCWWLEVARWHLLVLLESSLLEPSRLLETSLLALEASLWLSLEAAALLLLLVWVGSCGSGVSGGVGGVGGGLLSWEAWLTGLGKLLRDARAVTHHSKHSRARLQQYKISTYSRVSLWHSDSCTPDYGQGHLYYKV